MFNILTLRLIKNWFHSKLPKFLHVAFNLIEGHHFFVFLGAPGHKTVKALTLFCGEKNRSIRNNLFVQKVICNYLSCSTRTSITTSCQTMQELGLNCRIPNQFKAIPLKQ